MTWLEQGLQQAPPVGKEVTPFLLGYLGKASQGETTRVNRELLVANAQLAADIAQHL
jgi:pseudouridine-5'-phosphate glycosidase